QLSGLHALDDRRALVVPDLAHVEVPLAALRAGDAVPAEHDVAGGLHQPLALDHPLAVIGVLALAEERLQHRRLRLLELQKQRIGVVAAEHQDDPRARADAADTDYLARRVPVAKALQQTLAIALQRAPVATHHTPRELLDVSPVGEL